MQKVKVQRYVTGRKPKYFDQESDSDEDYEESDDEFTGNNKKILSHLHDKHQQGSMTFSLGKDKSLDEIPEDGEEDDDDDDDVRLKIVKNKEKEPDIDDDDLANDPRIRRLMRFQDNDRPTIKPEIISTNSSKNDESEEDCDLEENEYGELVRRRRRHREVIDAEEEDENAEENIERRHEILKQKFNKIDLKAQDEAFSEDIDDEEEDEESEFESEGSEDDLPRLKPIFISKKDRITINEKKEEEKKRAEKAEIEAKIILEERRRATLKIIEDERKREEEENEKNKAAAEEEAIIKGIASIVTDDEDDETAFELWKVRELRRIKREKEEEEQREQERREIERLRNMTEEERVEELKKNPKLVTNQQKKGKYKFLQKYYHRGVFYLDVEDDVFKRDFAQPTLEDHFDKSTLPTVMQVKNFGRAGRTKYTHLTDVDTTAFDSAWSAKDNVHAIQFHQTHGGGMRQSFERPSKRKK
ncbi:microfibrillar-associated protein 1-like protein [Sarcoptes scabiei]|nr:microfibrillar-associated protein 1-like protein [Sarcoptes scabiei]